MVSAIQKMDISMEYNEKFFENILFEYYKNNKINIEKFVISELPLNGDNYLSKIYRALVTFKKGDQNYLSISFVLKRLLQGQENEYLKKLQLFIKEKTAYIEIIPELESLLKTAKLAPRCFYTNSKPSETFVMEDLNALGYQLGNRISGLDESHCTLVLRKLGQFHAASMVLFKEKPHIYEKFDEGIFSKTLISLDILQNIYSQQLLTLIEVAKTWKDFEDIVKKLEIIKNNFIAVYAKSVENKPNSIKVFNHGDLWTTNILFKYKNGFPVDIVYIDYQMSFYHSLGIDINYFFATSLKLDVMKTKRENLINEYYTSLSTTLTQLNYEKIPSLSDVKKEIFDKELFGFLATFSNLPIARMDSAESTDNSINTFSNEELGKKKRKIMFSSKILTDILQYALKRYNELGVLDL